MSHEFEFCDHALQPLSGLVEAMCAAGIDRRCPETPTRAWERDDDRERALPAA